MVLNNISLLPLYVDVLSFIYLLFLCILLHLRPTSLDGRYMVGITVETFLNDIASAPNVCSTTCW